MVSKLLQGKDVAVRTMLRKLVKEMVVKGIRLEEAKQEFERNFLRQALVETGGRVGQAAETIGGIIHSNMPGCENTPCIRRAESFVLGQHCGDCKDTALRPRDASRSPLRQAKARQGERSHEP